MRRVACVLLYTVLFGSYLAIAQSAPASTPVVTSAAPPPVSPLVEADGLYRAHKYTDAMRKYDEALKQNPKSGAAYEGAVRTYLKLNMVKEAWTTAQEGLKQAPQDSLTHSAMGEALFRKGKFDEAQREFISAYNLSERDARAPYGLYRVYKSASYYGRAKEMLETAHAIDPQDPDIHRSWMAYRPRKERIAWLEQEADKETDKKERAWWQKVVEVLKAEEKSPHTCKLATKVTETQVPLKTLMPDPHTVEGVEIKAVINGKQMNLLLDTGASGVLIKKGPAGGAGLVPALETKIGGIGNEGSVEAYFSYADSIKVGALEFQNCIVEVTESTNKEGRQILSQFDGLIGSDVFSSYLVSIDFPGEKLTLKPLPKDPNEQRADPLNLVSAGEVSDDDDLANHNRYVAPEMRNYTPFFRFGHGMLIPTKIGDAEPKLFVIDSGASSSFISPEAAREVTQVGADLDWQVTGISGKVDGVSRARRMVMRFGRVSQEHLNMMAFDMSPISRSIGVDVAGFLGYTALGFMQMDIDYRDGLVNFTYDPKKYRPVLQWKPPTAGR